MPRRLMRTVLLVALAWILAQPPGYGQEVAVEPGSAKLLRLIGETGEQWEPASAEDLARLHAELEKLLGVQERVLSSLGNHGDGWRLFLRPDQLKAELSQAQPDAGRLERIARVQASAEPLLAAVKGYRSLAPALAGYAAQLRSAATTRDEFQHQLADLKQCLEVSQEGDGNEARERLAERLGWFEDRAAAGELVGAIRRQTRHPNVLLQASAALADAAVEDSRSIQSEVNESILGTSYRGRSRTDSTLELKLVADENQLATQLVWKALVNSQTRGYSGPATVSSQGTTNITASKLARLGPSGWQLEPATAQATTNSNITGVSVDRLFGRRVASQRAYEQKEATEREVARRARAGARTQLDRVVADMMSSTGDRFIRQLRMPLVIRDQFPSQVQIRSTAESIQLELLQANRRQAAACTEPPGWPPSASRPDLAVCLHASSLNNLAEGLFAGRRLSEHAMEDGLEKLFGGAPASLTNEDPEKTWTIRFASRKPLTVQMDQDRLTVEIRADELAVGEQMIPGSWITATYLLTVDSAGLGGQRDGSLQIVPADYDPHQTPRLGVRYQVFRSMLRKRFERVLPESFQWTSIALPADWPQAGSLRFTTLRAADQWLLVACRLEKATPATARR